MPARVSGYALIALGIVLLLPVAFFGLIYGAFVFVSPVMDLCFVLPGLGLVTWGVFRVNRDEPRA